MTCSASAVTPRSREAHVHAVIVAAPWPREMPAPPPPCVSDPFIYLHHHLQSASASPPKPYPLPCCPTMNLPPHHRQNSSNYGSEQHPVSSLWQLCSSMEQKIHVNPLKILSQTKCTHIQNSSSSCPNQLRRIRMPWILRGRSPPIARSLCKLMQMRQLPRLRLLTMTLSCKAHYPLCCPLMDPGPVVEAEESERP
ncbi:hypothetical protein ZEAMMB73_Zm00001d019624 [Zea mays]|uniref:Uncharacterized protein n=1 Tax=Zea mays TaxID=4577 RepID=A0A1D6HZB3_MAIZE|nr:hypothetical protein ZEAMMB73_Zm00001d019624 [Zea mays]